MLVHSQGLVEASCSNHQIGAAWATSSTLCQYSCFGELGLLLHPGALPSSAYMPIITFCPFCMQSLLGDSDDTIVTEATRLVCSSLSMLTAEQVFEPRPAEMELQPAEASTLLSKRARSESLTDPPLPGWDRVYESIIDLATKHRNPLARAAAMEGLCQVQMCFLAVHRYAACSHAACSRASFSNDFSVKVESPLHQRLPSDVSLAVYQTASILGLQDPSSQVHCACMVHSAGQVMELVVFITSMMTSSNSNPHMQVRHSACELVASSALLLGATRMRMPPKKQSSGRIGAEARSGLREGMPLLQFGLPLSVADHAFQCLCGLLLDPSPRVKVQALQGLAGENGFSLPYGHISYMTAFHDPSFVSGLGSTASSRVKLQAFSKKVTLVVQAPAGGLGPGVEAPSSLLDESAGALVHASEDMDGEVRQALACALPSLALNDAGEVCNADIADQAADYLLDLLHDEVGAA